MKIHLFAFCVLSTLTFSACTTTKVEKSIDEKISAETPSHEPAEIANQGAQTFADMPGISEDQRFHLLKINLETADQAQLIQTQILQTKSVLFKTLGTPNYKKSEINLLKKKLVKLDRQRLDLMFSTLGKVEKVLGQDSPSKEEVYKRLYLNEHRRF